MKEQALTIEELKIAAEKGNPEAMNTLGVRYLLGVLLKADIKKAVHWLTKAADAGHPEAMVTLANCYYQGLGVKKDKVKAGELYKKSADLGNPVALGFLATLRLETENQDSGEESAISLLIESAEKGDILSMLQLFNMYGDGNLDGRKLKTITPNEEKKYYWLSRAAEANSRYAQVCYGLTLLFGKEGFVPADTKKALEYLNKAADNHSQAARSILGFLYEFGLIVEKNLEKAIEYYLRAIEKDPLPPEYTAIDAHFKLTAIEPKTNTKESYQFGEGNAGVAWYRLGLCYEKGKWFPKNLEAAIRCYRDGCEAGETHACERLEALKKSK